MVDAAITIRSGVSTHDGGNVRVVEVPLETGERVLVEVSESPGVDRVGRADRVVETAKQTLEEGLDRVQPVIGAVVRRFRDMVDPPDKVTLQFGLKATGELGLVIGKATTEANFTISAEWRAGS